MLGYTGIIRFLVTGFVGEMFAAWWMLHAPRKISDEAKVVLSYELVYGTLAATHSLSGLFFDLHPRHGVGPYLGMRGLRHVKRGCSSTRAANCGSCAELCGMHS